MALADEVFWQEGNTRISSTCPICATSAEHVHLLDMADPFEDRKRLHLLKCSGCASGFVHDFSYPDYDDYNITPQHLRFYVEQGAGLDILAKPGFLAKHFNANSYLEIGCGYGFGVDFAEKGMGLKSRGIDPASQAKHGREALSIRIDSDYLTEETGKTLGLNDFIVAMEVIEHIADPASFVEILKKNLTDKGVVIMSTPNINALENRHHPMLLPLLTPGFHAVLFSPEALKNLFLKAGFASVSVTAGEDSIFLIASLSERELDVDAILDSDAFRQAFIDYTRDRMEQLGANNSLWSGFSYRLLKALVNSGRYEESASLLEELIPAFRDRFDVDLENPVAIMARHEMEADADNNFANKSDWAEALPYNLGNLLYFIGILKMNTIGDKEAYGYFLASTRLSQSHLTQYDLGGYGDGETSDLLKHSYTYLARCACTLASS